MKKITLILSMLIVAICSYSQSILEYDDVYIRNKLILGDSTLKTATEGDTVATKKYVDDFGGQWTKVPQGIEYIDGRIEIDSLYFKNGGTLKWNTGDNTVDVNTGFGSIIQVGQELQIKVYNNTGSLIPNGKAVYPNGNFNSFPTIGLAQSDTYQNIEVDYGLTTTDIGIDQYGMVVWFGKANDINTTGVPYGEVWNIGDEIYISPDVAGALTNVRPSFPDYVIQIGICLKVSATEGIIFVTSRSSVEDTYNNFWNGVFRENFDFVITESGGVITGSLSPANGHDDMTMFFSDGFSTLTTTPAATITLTAGTDVNPQQNFVYIPKSTKVLTVSTSGFPETEHIKVAQCLLQSAATTGVYGALRNQNINDPIENTTTFQGHLSHITERIRQLSSKWDSGVEATVTIQTASTPDDVWVSTTAGTVYQMHKQNFTAKNTQTGDVLYVVNDNVSPYKIISNINEILTDATGASLNSTSFSLVMWGAMNKTGEPSHLMINLPTGSYGFSFPQNAVNDANNYSVYTIPKTFQGVGFLIARFTFTYKNDEWVLIDTEDLRGFSPNTSAGGGVGGVGVTSFLGLNDTPSSFTAKSFQVANSGATALENSIGLVYDNTTERMGIGTTTPLSALHINKGTGSLATGISFGDGNSGFYESSDNVINVELAGSLKAQFNLGGFGFGSAARPFITFGASTRTVPAYRLASGNLLTGIGGDANSFNEVSLIANGVEIARAVEDVTQQFRIDPQSNLAGTTTAPSLAFGDGDCGGFEPVDDALQFVADSVLVDTLRVEKIKFGDGTTQTKGVNITGNNNEILRSDGSGGVKTDSRSTWDGTRLYFTESNYNNYFDVDFTESAPSIDFYLTEATEFGWFNFYGDKDNYYLGLADVVDTTSYILRTGGISPAGSSVYYKRFELTTKRDASKGGYAGGEAGVYLIPTKVTGEDYNGAYLVYDETTTTGSADMDRNAVHVNEKAIYFYNNNTLVGQWSDDSLYTSVSIKGNHGFASETGTMQIEKAEILYTNTAQTTIITLPANAVIWNIGLDVKTAFNGTGTDFINIGITGETGRYAVIDGSVVNFSNSNNEDSGYGTTIPEELSSSTNVTFRYVDSNSDATQGIANVYIHYTLH